MKFNLDLILSWDKSKSLEKCPYLAMFRTNNKTLIYCASEHCSKKTYDMIDYVFENFSPQISIVEYEPYRVMNFSDKHESVYVSLKSEKSNSSVVLSDLGYDFNTYKKMFEINDKNLILCQADWIINNMKSYKNIYKKKTTIEKDINNFNIAAEKNNFPKADVDKIKNWFLSEYETDINEFDLEEIDLTPRSKGKKLNVFYDDVNKFIRDPFMLKNIEKALNKYDTVFACFGEGHYRSQRLVLENSLGEPEYIFEAKGKENLDLKDFIKIETLK